MKTKKLVAIHEQTSRLGNDYYNLPADFLNMEEYLKDHIIVIEGEEYGHKFILKHMVPSSNSKGSAFIWSNSIPTF